METLIIQIKTKTQAAEIKKALALFKGVNSVYSADEAENYSMISGIESGLKTQNVPKNDVLNALK